MSTFLKYISKWQAKIKIGIEKIILKKIQRLSIIYNLILYIDKIK